MGNAEARKITTAIARAGEFSDKEPAAVFEGKGSPLGPSSSVCRKAGDYQHKKKVDFQSPSTFFGFAYFVKTFLSSKTPYFKCGTHTNYPIFFITISPQHKTGHRSPLGAMQTPLKSFRLTRCKKGVPSVPNG